MAVKPQPNGLQIRVYLSADDLRLLNELTSATSETQSWVMTTLARAALRCVASKKEKKIIVPLTLRMDD